MKECGMNKTTNQDAARVAGQKFNVGDKISWKGSDAIVREVRAQRPWASYVIECDNGKHVLEFADQSFCDLLTRAH
jgi:hypothetical protein